MDKTTSDGHALVRRGLVYYTICGIRQWNESEIRPGREITCPYCRMNAVVHPIERKATPPWPGGRPNSRHKATKAQRIKYKRDARLRVA